MLRKNVVAFPYLSSILLLWGIGLFSPAAIFAQTYTVTTTATFLDSKVPSSTNDSFSVTLLQTNPVVEGSLTYRACAISGVPAEGAVSVGNCRWTEFVDDGFDLLLFTFNWQDAGDVGTNAVWGQFCLLNDFGAGNWVRFFTADGKSEGVVGSASGSLTYTPSGLPPIYSNNLYVDASVTTSGDGTEASSFKTILEAIRAAEPSTGIHIAAGTYNELVPIAIKNNIGLIGVDKDAVVIANSNLDDDFTILCNTVDGLGISHLTVTGENGIGMVACPNAEFVNIAVNGSSQNGIVVANLDASSPSTASSLTLHDSTITANTYGVSVDHTSSLSAYNTEFNNNTDQGVKVTSSGAVIIEACDLSGNNRFGLGWQNLGSEPGTLSVSNSTITNNSLNGLILLNAVDGTIENSIFTGNGTSGRFNGLEVERSWVGTLTVANSTFRENTSFGIFVGSGNVILQSNIIEENGQNGVGIHQSTARGTSQTINVELRGNTIQDHVGTDHNDGAGLILHQEDGPAMSVTLDGETAGPNTLNNNARHASCSSQINPFNLTCDANIYGSSQRGTTTCNRNLCSPTDCPELCL